MPDMKDLKEKIMEITSSREKTELLAELFRQEFEKIQRQQKEKRIKSQKEGIKRVVAQGGSFGRPKKKPPENFYLICKSYRKGDLKAEEAAELSGMSVSTFYRKMKEQLP